MQLYERGNGHGILYVASIYDGTRYHYRECVAMSDADAKPPHDMRISKLGRMVSVRRQDNGELVWKDWMFSEDEYGLS